MTIGGAIALVVFFAFAMQCTSTLAVVRRETNSLRWPIIQFCYMSGLAYMAALITNQVFARRLLSMIPDVATSSAPENGGVYGDISSRTSSCRNIERLCRS